MATKLWVTLIKLWKCYVLIFLAVKWEIDSIKGGVPLGNAHRSPKVFKVVNRKKKVGPFYGRQLLISCQSPEELWSFPVLWLHHSSFLLQPKKTDQPQLLGLLHSRDLTCCFASSLTQSSDLCVPLSWRWNFISKSTKALCVEKINHLKPNTLPSLQISVSRPDDVNKVRGAREKEQTN